MGFDRVALVVDVDVNPILVKKHHPKDLAMLILGVSDAILGARIIHAYPYLIQSRNVNRHSLAYGESSLPGIDGIPSVKWTIWGSAPSE